MLHTLSENSLCVTDKIKNQLLNLRAPTLHFFKAAKIV